MKRRLLNQLGRMSSKRVQFSRSMSTIHRPQGMRYGLAVGVATLGLGFTAAMYDTAFADTQTEDVIMQNMRFERHDRRLRQMKIFSGTANIPLAEEIAGHLNTSLGKIMIKEFADGEIGIQVLENVRGKDVYLIQPTCPPNVNSNIMELILLISTMRRASARTITAVLPYYGYARQDRKMISRVPISAADVARLLEAMGVDRVVAVDLHCGQIQGFFGPRTPCDNLDGSVVALPYFENVGLKHDHTVIVSPDAGGVYRAKRFRDGLKSVGVDAGLAMIVKQRERANQIAQMDLVGDVSGCDCIIVDDMIDTAGTLCKAGAELKKRGADRIFAFATHGLLNGPAVDRIGRSDFEKVVITNSIPLPPKKRIDQIEAISIGRLLAQALYSVHFRKSISGLFDSLDGSVNGTAPINPPRNKRSEIVKN